MSTETPKPTCCGQPATHENFLGGAYLICEGCAHLAEQYRCMPKLTCPCGEVAVFENFLDDAAPHLCVKCGISANQRDRRMPYSRFDCAHGWIESPRQMGRPCMRRHEKKLH